MHSILPIKIPALELFFLGLREKSCPESEKKLI
jgi:hypothetical protein